MNQEIPTIVTIVLTTTVYIKPTIDCSYQYKPDERILTYLVSLYQWLYKTNFNIILVENSGYTFPELNEEKIKYKDRFEVITFNEAELQEASYLKNISSKGASEVFSINYACQKSKIINPYNFIIKVTGRFFIPELESYLKSINLNEYDCLTQYNRTRCEMVGAHCNYFNFIFNINLVHKINNEDICIINAEEMWNIRTSALKKVLVCKRFTINKTPRGGVCEIYDNI